MFFKRFLLIGLFVLNSVSYVFSQNKVALVIGNKNYSSHTQLKNPINDAKLIKKTLESLDFKVLEAYDADINKLDKSINTFMGKAKKADVALIYYAGHGIGVEGRNYLIPLDTNNLSKSNLSRKLISLNELQDSVSKAKKFGVVLFDACRNSFFRQNIEGLGNARASRALVRPTVRNTSNILVSFSTQAGTIAKDDVEGGRHSPYALALSEKLKEQKDIRLVMGGVKDRVLQLTDYQQEPIDRSSLGGDEFYITTKVIPKPINTGITLPEVKIDKPVKVTKKHKNITKIGNLMWQDEAYIEKENNAYIRRRHQDSKGFGKALKWNDSKNYCEQLKLADYSDWRLPSKEALETLHSRDIKRLSNIKDGYYWSSLEDEDLVWFVPFKKPLEGGWWDKNRVYYTRCVRDK